MTENDLIQAIATDVRAVRDTVLILSNKVAAGFATSTSHFIAIDEKLTKMPSCSSCDPTKAIAVMNLATATAEGVHQADRRWDNKNDKLSRKHWGLITAAAIVASSLITWAIAIWSNASSIKAAAEAAAKCSH